MACLPTLVASVPIWLTDPDGGANIGAGLLFAVITIPLWFASGVLAGVLTRRMQPLASVRIAAAAWLAALVVLAIIGTLATREASTALDPVALVWAPSLVCVGLIGWGVGRLVTFLTRHQSRAR